MRARLHWLPVFLIALTGCHRAAAGTSAEPRVAGQERGVSYFERTTGGADADEKLPMIVAMHGRGGNPKTFEKMFSAFPAKARLIIPYGDPNGHGGYSWYAPSSRRDDPDDYADGVRSAADKVAGAIADLRGKRPTVGRAVVCGFSQGGVLSFALAVLHPEQVAAAFPMSGHLPQGIWGGTWSSDVRPYIHAYHGVRDGTFDRARASIFALQQSGARAELSEYPMGHELSADEVASALSEIASVVTRGSGP